VCGPGEFGNNCTARCNCEDGAACNTTTGLCPTGGCKPGWTGNSCDTSNALSLDKINLFYADNLFKLVLLVSLSHKLIEFLRRKSGETF